MKWWVVLPLSPQSRLIIKHLQTLYTDLYTKTPDFNTFGRFLCAFFAGFYSFLYTTGQNVHDQGFNAFFLVIEDSLKND